MLEVIDNRDRFVRIYDPTQNHTNHSFITIYQEGHECIGKIIRQYGQHRIDVDLLSGRLNLGNIKVSKSTKSYGITTGNIKYSELKWEEIKTQAKPKVFEKGKV